MVIATPDTLGVKIANSVDVSYNNVRRSSIFLYELRNMSFWV